RLGSARACAQPARRRRGRRVAIRLPRRIAGGQLSAGCAAGPVETRQPQFELKRRNQLSDIELSEEHLAEIGANAAREAIAAAKTNAAREAYGDASAAGGGA